MKNHPLFDSEIIFRKRLIIYYINLAVEHKDTAKFHLYNDLRDAEIQKVAELEMEQQLFNL